MDFAAHITAGAAAGLGMAYVANKIGLEETGALLIAGSIAGALLPDSDIQYSLAGKILPLWLFLDHRGQTHSLFFVGVAGLLGLFFGLPYSLILGLCVGIATHLMLDSLTPMRLPYLLWPFRYRRIYLHESKKKRSV